MRADVLVGGKYRLLRAIGAGGMGSVWLARNEMTEREFAIKFLHAHAASSPKMLQRFFQEARVSGKLRHPSILEIYDVGTAAELDGAPYLVMEHLDGAPLDGVIRKLGRLPLGVALEVTATIARATAMAHDKGIVHRDLKPANVFLHRPGTGAVVPKVLDFGISKILTQPDSAASLGLTQTGAVLGSPLYMSPEQVEGLPTLDARSDVYSLGVVLWECLVGYVPYRATTYNLLIVEKLAHERPHLRDVLPDAPPALDALIARVLMRDRERRFGTARELAESLDALRATLGLGNVLDRTTAAQWLFAQLKGVSAPPPPLRMGGVADSTTTGAVSVPRGSLPSNPSPNAYTVQSAHDDASPFARTALAEDSGERHAPPPTARAVTAGSGSGQAVTAPRAATSRRGARVAIGAGAAIVLMGAIVGTWHALTPRADHASATLPSASIGADMSALPSATPIAAPPASAASTAVIPSAAPAPSAALIPSATPTAAPTSRPPPASPGGHRTPPPTPPPARPHVKEPGPANANHGIVDDGL